MAQKKEYCKICGKAYKSRRSVLSHVRAKHDLKTADYDSIADQIPDAAIELWNKTPGLQESFPVPGDFNAGTGKFANFMDWVEKRGAQQNPKIAKELEKIK